jgi:ABC-2 type transport system permease protein
MTTGVTGTTTIVTGARPQPAGAVTATLAFGYRAMLKIRHVPEQLLDVIAIPVVFTLMFTYLFACSAARWPARPAGTCRSCCPARW